MATANNQDQKVAAQQGIASLLASVGEEALRDGLRDTPGRFVKAFGEMTEGYKQDPKKILSRQFEQEDSVNVYNGIVVLSGISFFSLCEHHLLPFYGTVDIAYIPNSETKRIVGISKLARLVECYAKRLQVQERLNCEITNAVATHLKADGVLVTITGKHMCMMARGVKQSYAQMVTSEVRGSFETDASARAEAFRLFDRR